MKEKSELQNIMLTLLGLREGEINFIRHEEDQILSFPKLEITSKKYEVHHDEEKTTNNLNRLIARNKATIDSYASILKARGLKISTSTSIGGAPAIYIDHSEAEIIEKLGSESHRQSNGNNLALQSKILKLQQDVIQHPNGTTLSSPKGTTPLALNGTT
ncbi:hypothetical protein [Legionella sp. MW5194]|uniref:hypothetical protein n=1 Tax=Legionella sp. MW5194 TaxID=2662448 RepID=UPI00193D6FB5|nr:hypothetical protein [Legionella sp. MW5194]